MSAQTPPAVSTAPHGTQALNTACLASRLLAISCVAALLVLPGCGSAEDTGKTDPEPPMAEAKPSGTPAGGAEPSGRTGPFELQVDGFVFQVPEGWREAELSAMQRGIISARLIVPAEPEDVTVTFSTVGGGLDANLDRWIGQFQRAEPVRDKRKIAGLSAHVMDLRGTFSTMEGGSPTTKPDWMMLGVAVERDPREFYIKCSGPRSAVVEMQGAYEQLLDSARLAD